MTTSIQQVICVVVNIVATSTISENLTKTEALQSYLNNCVKLIEKIISKIKIKAKVKFRLLLGEYIYHRGCLHGNLMTLILALKGGIYLVEQKMLLS